MSVAARACASGIRNKDLALRIRQSQGEFQANSYALRQAASAHLLHTVTSKRYFISGLDDAELKKLYTQQMVKSSRPGRAVYSAIMARALHGLCSYCQNGVAYTLDHFVPKSGVPALSIDPWNLVPCCRDCNSQLGQHYATEPTKQLFHPYDVPDLGRWLQVRIEHTQPIAATFYAKPADSLPVAIGERLQHQFSTLGLSSMYAVVSAQDITGTSRLLRTYSSGYKPDQVSSQLHGFADALFSDAINARRAVLLEGLADDAWYCTTGFLG